MNIISLYSNFAHRGGAQNVAIQVAHFFSTNPTILTCTKDSEIDNNYKKCNVLFRRLTLKNILRYRKDIFLSHSRNLTSVICILNKIGLGIKIIHVSHSLFTNKRLLTFFPPAIIAVSYAVKENLVDYFGIKPDRVKVIYNGLKDTYIPDHIKDKGTKTKLLIAARLCPLKRQIDLVTSLRGHVPNDIEICFAGIGEDLEELNKAIKDDHHFKYVGLIDINEELYHYHYVCLFSYKEGLPLSLIEGCMYGKPLLTNSIKPCLEVNHDGKNGIVVSDFNELKDVLKSLPRVNTDLYDVMSKKSREVYEELFTETIMKKKYIEIINDYRGKTELLSNSFE